MIERRALRTTSRTPAACSDLEPTRAYCDAPEPVPAALHAPMGRGDEREIESGIGTDLEVKGRPDSANALGERWRASPSSQAAPSPASVRLSRPARRWLAPGVALLALSSGCYQGEWRAGVEVPIATTSRLLPTRSIETWELSHTQTPYIVQIKGTSTPRCRHALYGKARRIDTGKFERVGGGFWTAIAIGLGAVGGAAAGFGGAGYVSDLQPALGRPIMYGVGGAMIAGGLAACFTALARPAKLRYAMCGIFTGLGASVVGGALVSGLAAPGTATTAKPEGTPILDVSLLQTIMIAGGGGIAGSIATGLVGNRWSGYEDRVRAVDVNNAALWDAQQSETTCGQVTALYGRTVGLDIVAENLQTGLGSEVTPLKLRVALSSQSTQPVDLRALRQALPSCGALRVTLSPEVVYEEFTDDYTPPVTPDQVNIAGRPVFGQILPREGLILAPPETRQRVVPKTALVPGLSPETLVNVERQCRGEAPLAPVGKRTPAAGPRPGPRVPAPIPQQPDPAPLPTSEPPATQPAPPAIPPPPPESLPSEDVVFSTPGLQLPRATPGQSEEGECSLNAQRARFSDCEAQCSRALTLNPCVQEFRKCYLDSRGSTQVQHDRDQCNLNWEQCLFRVGVSPGSWRRCVEGCAQANEPFNCQRKPERSGP